ncbi:hypothetical protein J3Q64DRAFT_1808890 [Phycomyces blakesleeanus]|uniref:SWIM-type domain-containing protein n=1 Tax=Phycomyces blakesleeanus TaxID=4837 RepID=A0ABR3B5M0_PHYBL
MSTVNITSTNENIYTLATISEALECSSIPGVMTFRLNSTIRVRTSEWKECLVELSKFCAVKWTIHNSNKRRTDITAEEAKNSGIKMWFSQEYLCHCSGTYESKAEMRVVQKRTKKNKCSALLHVREFFKTPKWYEITLTKDHADHTPGDIREDIRTLLLAKKYLHKLSQQLEQSSKSASQIRIHMLRAIDRYGRSSDRKLSAMNFSIFKGKMSYSPNTNAFAYGFMSPTQQIKMRNAVSFCLDATHAISGKIDEILYTLLVHDKEISRGWPVAFIVTNDQGVGPISSLLLINPQQITIDCYYAEVHAIQTTFPSTQIQFCALPSEARLLRGKMMRYLQDIVYEDDLDHEFSDQELFLDYFEKNWCTEKKVKIWSRAYHEWQFSHMLTNNYIESSRNKRLDKLVFILIHDVEYYLAQEYKRVMSNNGAMSSFTRQQRIREIEAEEIDDDARETIATDRLIMKCTCFNFERRQKTCKHMHLLKMHTAFSLHFSTTPLNPTYEHNRILGEQAQLVYI